MEVNGVTLHLIEVGPAHTDGDCIVHPSFIQDHIEQQEKGRYLAGRRIELGESISRTLSRARLLKGVLKPFSVDFVKSVIFGDTEHWNRSLRWKSPLLRKWLKMNRIDDLKGCNFSISREDLFAINGFDESYEGYGREDTDVEIRLQHLGLKIKSLKGLALQYHVWHPRRGFTPQNEDLLNDVKTSGRVKAKIGLTEKTS
ncbi:MAG: hypothetical protein EOP09_11925 [Proteobacteria bacterium]|nr:MAG: hypothetical protein EOP09_11925 [Pseudomonadota bacterium]